MAWFRKTPAAWIGLFLTVTTSVAGLYVRAALADTGKDVAVLQERQDKTEKEIEALKRKAEDTNEKVTEIWKWLAEQRGQR